MMVVPKVLRECNDNWLDVFSSSIPSRAGLLLVHIFDFVDYLFILSTLIYAVRDEINNALLNNKIIKFIIILRKTDYILIYKWINWNICNIMT